LFGDARIDLAVVNGKLHGYEIKSDADTLKRLPAQAEVYSAVFDLVTIVVGEHHLDTVRAIVPECGASSRRHQGTGNAFGASGTEAKSITESDGYRPTALAAEALSLLREASLDCGVKSKPREAIYGRLVESFPLGELRRLVRCQLRLGRLAIWSNTVSMW